MISYLSRLEFCDIINVQNNIKIKDKISQNFEALIPHFLIDRVKTKPLEIQTR